MTIRNKELRELKKHSIQALWFWILLMCTFFIGIGFWIYAVTIFQNKYIGGTFSLSNDIAILVISGILIGLLLLLFAFVVLKYIKKCLIKDFFEFYCYVNSLSNKNRLNLIQDQKLASLYHAKKAQTREEYINFVAQILGYELTSIDYKNLKNEIEEDFAKHAFKDPDFSKLKSDTFTKVIFLDLIIPALVATAFIILAIVYPFDKLFPILSAVSRLSIILATMFLTLGIGIASYELTIVANINKVEKFNNFFMLSFNSYNLKLLNSSTVKIR